MEISADIPDWKREKVLSGMYEPSKYLLKSIRAYQYNSAKHGVLNQLKKRINVLTFRIWSIVCGADIPLNSNIGGGLLLPHPNGVVINPNAEIGPNCLLFQQVTIGGGTADQCPTIGGHVDIGAGAKILGKVTIGNHAKIGANSVVLNDVPAYATAIGIPARVIQRK